MTFSTLKRPALGQTATLGSLYDARTDNFLPSCLLNGLRLTADVTISENHKSHIIVGSDDSYKEKFADMGLSSDLSASFLAGLINVGGSGRYLEEGYDTHTNLQRHLHYTIETMLEKLNFTNGEVKDGLDLETLRSGQATHVVSEVNWGGQSIVSAQRRLSKDEDRKSAVERLESIFNKFEEVTVPNSIRNDKHPTEATSSESLKYEIFSDIAVTEYRSFDYERMFDDSESEHEFGVEKPISQDFQSVYRFLTQMPKHIKAVNNGRGLPITYTLLPFEFFAVFFAVQSPAFSAIKQVSTEYQEKFISILDEQRRASQSLNDYHDKLEGYRFCIPSNHQDDVSDRIRAATRSAERLRAEYTSYLKNLRAGKADPQQLSHLCDAFLRSKASPEKLVALTLKYAKKLEFVTMVQNRGGQYLGYGGLSVAAALREHPRSDAFMFHFNEEVMNKHEAWKVNEELLLETLEKHGRDTPIWLVDGDAKGLELEKPYMSHYVGGTVTTEDLLDTRKMAADRCIVRYDEAALDPSAITLPSQRRLMTVPCPGPRCNLHTPCDWICSKCHLQVEYGKVDAFLYCECGRVPFDRWSFKCKDPAHGSGFVTYGKRELFNQLEHLGPRTELNVLILGETGVGKSTFVNAFVNYLAFPSLDEGMLAQELNCIIPCSFSTQDVDTGGKLVQKEVRIGSDRDEHDGMKGESATQKTMVYPLYIGNYMVRLIDTPGIGDTRGVEQDKKNFQDVLSVLRNYEKLHGVLILLKPNDSRLTVMFRFCVKELLTHLHRNAAANMAFGFTNTRGSNYRPGDTFSPLEALLSEYKDVIPGLFNHNVYCFDSESFRYLAARKQGIDMGNLEDYRRSWDHSASEAQRLLTYFSDLNPHHVRSTLSLNETRYLIEQLIAPMARISKTITQSIALNKADAQALSDTRLTGKALVTKLNSQKVTLTAHQLSEPKTVCGHKKCVKVHRGTDMPGDEMQILYTTICHNPCCLKNVPPNSIGPKELERCNAFRGNGGRCKRCKHDWTEHLHIVVEYTERSETVTDSAVQKALDKNGDVIQAKEAAIKAKKRLIKELSIEHAQIQEAQARFTIYLRNISITPYNDATLEYYDHLIKEEKSKVGFGASPARLNGLEHDRHQYAEFVEAMTSGLETGSTFYQPLDEEGVYQLVENLYNLKHNGTDLREIAKVVEMAHAATHREKIYRINVRTDLMTAAAATAHRGRPERSPMVIPIRQYEQHLQLAPDQRSQQAMQILRRPPLGQTSVIPRKKLSQKRSGFGQSPQQHPRMTEAANYPIRTRLFPGLSSLHAPQQLTHTRSNAEYPTASEKNLPPVPPPPYEAYPTVIRPSAATSATLLQSSSNNYISSNHNNNGSSNSAIKAGWLKNQVNKLRKTS